MIFLVNNKLEERKYAYLHESLNFVMLVCRNFLLILWLYDKGAELKLKCWL